MKNTEIIKNLKKQKWELGNSCYYKIFVDNEGMKVTIYYNIQPSTFSYTKNDGNEEFYADGSEITKVELENILNLDI